MRIRLLQDSNGDGIFDRGKIFADKISMTMGALWYRGSLYVGAPPDFLRFDDTNLDGVADHREVIMTGWPLHSNGTTLHGPFLGPDGLMYLTYNLGHYQIDSREGRRMEGPGGRVWRMRPDGTGLEWIVGGGYDNGIEMVFNAAGVMFGTMTYYRNPRLGERDALVHYVEGGLYPKVTPIANNYKPTGAIYRVRRKGAPRVEDPWGLNLKLETRPPAELAKSLDDPRPAVRDKAVDLLVQAGEPAVEPLIRVRETHKAPEVRASAVFAL